MAAITTFFLEERRRWADIFPRGSHDCSFLVEFGCVVRAMQDLCVDNNFYVERVIQCFVLAISVLSLFGGVVCWGSGRLEYSSVCSWSWSIVLCVLPMTRTKQDLCFRRSSLKRPFLGPNNNIFFKLMIKCILLGIGVKNSVELNKIQLSHRTDVNLESPNGHDEIVILIFNDAQFVSRPSWLDAFYL